jgi:hypothetical protein
MPTTGPDPPTETEPRDGFQWPHPLRGAGDVRSTSRFRFLVMMNALLLAMLVLVLGGCSTPAQNRYRHGDFIMNIGSATPVIVEPRAGQASPAEPRRFQRTQPRLAGCAPMKSGGDGSSRSPLARRIAVAIVGGVGHRRRHRDAGAARPGHRRDSLGPVDPRDRVRMGTALLAKMPDGDRAVEGQGEVTGTTGSSAHWRFVHRCVAPVRAATRRTPDSGD